MADASQLVGVNPALYAGFNVADLTPFQVTLLQHASNQTPVTPQAPAPVMAYSPPPPPPVYYAPAPAVVAFNPNPTLPTTTVATPVVDLTPHSVEPIPVVTLGAPSASGTFIDPGPIYNYPQSSPSTAPIVTPLPAPVLELPAPKPALTAAAYAAQRPDLAVNWARANDPSWIAANPDSSATASNIRSFGSFVAYLANDYGGAFSPGPSFPVLDYGGAAPPAAIVDLTPHSVEPEISPPAATPPATAAAPIILEVPFVSTAPEYPETVDPFPVSIVTAPNPLSVDNSSNPANTGDQSAATMLDQDASTIDVLAGINPALYAGFDPSTLTAAQITLLRNASNQTPSNAIVTNAAGVVQPSQGSASDIYVGRTGDYDTWKSIQADGSTRVWQVVAGAVSSSPLPGTVQVVPVAASIIPTIPTTMNAPTAAAYATSRPDLVNNWNLAHDAAYIASHPGDQTIVYVRNFPNLDAYLAADYGGALAPGASANGMAAVPTAPSTTPSTAGGSLNQGGGVSPIVWIGLAAAAAFFYSRSRSAN